MAAALSEQIVAAVQAALTGAIAAVGSRVYRREDALAANELPAILLSSGVEDPQVVTLAGDVSRVEFDFSVAIHVAGGDVWETIADPITVSAHALIAALTLPGTATTLTGPVITDDSLSGDDTPAVRLLTYTVTYYRQAAALDAAA